MGIPVLSQQYDGDALVAPLEVPVAGEVGVQIEQFAGPFVEDAPVFSRHGCFDAAAPLMVGQGGADTDAQFAAYAGGAVTVDEFDDFGSLGAGPDKLACQPVACLLDGGHAVFQIDDGDFCCHGG